MSIQNTSRRVNSLLLEIKECLKNGQFVLPLVKCIRQFDYEKKIMVRRNPTTIIFSKTSISFVLRIVQILMIIRKILLNNKFITKRNLYYQLVKYYPSYMMIDTDIQIICDSLKIQRSLLNIIVSSKLQMFWFNNVKFNKSHQTNIELSYKKFIQQNQVDIKQYNNQPNQDKQRLPFVQKQHIILLPHQIFKIPNCPKIQLNILYPKNYDLQDSQKVINFLIMQKQSLFQILTQSLTYKLPAKNQNWFLMNSKGYPDMTALQFVNQMIKKSNQNNINFYYIGDYDVYGIDIMFNYAIGNEYFEGLWPKLKWLVKFEQVLQYQNIKNPQFQHKFEQSQYQKLTVQDKKKARQILSRDYLQLQKMRQIFTNKQNKQNNDKDKLYYEKSQKWRNLLTQLVNKQYQCEVESYFKNWHYPFDLIQLMIQNQFYI